MATDYSSANQTLPPTASRCLPQSITTTHNFEVKKFSLLDGMGIGYWVGSTTFSVGGCDWSIAFYPDGRSKRKADYVSIFLYYLRGPEGCVRAKFSFSLLHEKNKVFRTEAKSKGTRRRKVSRRHGTHTFEQVEDYCGWYGFIEKSKLRELLHTSGDCFTIMCVLTVIQEDVTVADASAIVVPPSNLHQDLSRMLKDEKGADVIFRVQDEVFHAHRNVLAARSAVFEEEFFVDMNDTAPQHFIGIDEFF